MSHSILAETSQITAVVRVPGGVFIVQRQGRIMSAIGYRERSPGAQCVAVRAVREPSRQRILQRIALASCLVLGGCTNYIAADGPRTGAVEAAPRDALLRGIELVKVNYAVADRLREDSARERFSRVFQGSAHADHEVGPGDVLQVFIWEAPPAMLFTTQTVAAGGMTFAGSGMVSLPDQTVDDRGDIKVPFAGTVHVAGLTLAQIESNIRATLIGKANHPQVIVRLAANNTQNVTVVGDISHSMEVPMDPGGLRLLRALALAGGVTRPVEKTSIQLSRDGQVATLPLQTVLRDPSENILLRAGDVVTALYQPSSFTVMGAVGRNAEVNFEASGITLAQALARAGGVDDNRSNPTGVFLFRFETPDALRWPQTPHLLVHGKVPTIYQFDLRDPATFFAAQTFPVDNHDLIYVSNAPVTDLQKVLNVVGAIVYPFQSLQTMGVIK